MRNDGELTIAVRQHEIDDTKIEELFFERLSRLLLICRSHNLKFRRLEPHADQLQKIRIVVYNQYATF